MEKEQLEKMDMENFLLLPIQMITLYCQSFNLEEFKKWKDRLHSDLVRYEALGIVDGHAYHKKVDTKRALLQRMEAIYNLAKVVQETKDLIDLEAIKPKTCVVCPHCGSNDIQLVNNEIWECSDCNEEWAN